MPPACRVPGWGKHLLHSILLCFFDSRARLLFTLFHLSRELLKNYLLIKQLWSCGATRKRSDVNEMKANNHRHGFMNCCQVLHTMSFCGICVEEHIDLSLVLKWEMMIGLSSLLSSSKDETEIFTASNWTTTTEFSIADLQSCVVQPRPFVSGGFLAHASWSCDVVCNVGGNGDRKSVV